MNRREDLTTLFISYSTQDDEPAHRIYYDLTRSGARPWLYEIDGESGENFRKEIFRKLDDTEYFCLIDSSNARDSKWVKEECKYFQDLRNNSYGKKKILICAIEDLEKENKSLFENHHDIRYVDFLNYDKKDKRHRLDRLDYREEYSKGMNELCKCIGIEFLPWSNIPGYRDFEKEIFSYDIDISDREIMITDYKNFIQRYKNNSKSSEDRIKIILKDCGDKGIQIMSTYIALGAILSDKGETNKAHEIYSQATKNFENDPRGWIGLAALEYYEGNYNIALDYFEKALQEIISNPDNQYNYIHYGEVTHNKLRVLLALDKDEEAKKLLEAMDNTLRNLPEIQLGEILLLLKSNKRADAEKLYEKLSKRVFKNISLNTAELNMSLSDMEECLGKFYSDRHITAIAIKHFERGVHLLPRSIRYRTNLALAFLADGQIERGTECVKNGLELKPENDIDVYFCGFLHFLNGNKNVADSFFQKSKHLGYDYYAELVTLIQ